jgi:maltose O-acetyltransferase
MSVAFILYANSCRGGFMMREEERIMKGVLFSPSDPELKTIKRRAHNLSQRYSQTFEEQTEERN